MKLLLGGIGSMILGAFFCLGAVRMFRETSRLRRDEVNAQATVVRIEQELNPEYNIWYSPAEDQFFYYPVFTFTDTAGNQHTVRSKEGRMPSVWAIGDTVQVIYPVDAPGSAQLDSFLNSWDYPLIIAGFGVVLFFVGLKLVLFSRS